MDDADCCCCQGLYITIASTAQQRLVKATYLTLEKDVIYKIRFNFDSAEIIVIGNIIDFGIGPTHSSLGVSAIWKASLMIS